LISELHVLPHAWISTARILSIPGHLYLFSFTVTISTLKELGSATNGSAYALLPAMYIQKLTNVTICSKHCRNMPADHPSHPLLS